MKTRRLLTIAAAAALSTSISAQDGYTLRTLTFEDSDYRGSGSMQSTGKADWSSLIDSPQYGGKLLYGESGSGSTTSYYYWADEDNTMLAHEFPLNWGSYCYWGGGQAISNYNSGDVEAYGDFTHQLTAFKEGVKGMAQTGGGYDGSDNFCVDYGYHDNSGYSSDNVPAIYFYDGEARVIDHMYVNNICYNVGCYVNGNGLTAKIGDSDWVKLVATGYDANGDKITDKTAEIYLCNGPDNIVEDWTRFDLSVLGPVTRVEFNVTGSSDNGYGFSQPAYFAYDNVAVRFPATTGISAVNGQQTAWPDADAPAYNLGGQRVGKNYKGVVIVNGRKVLRK